MNLTLIAFSILGINIAYVSIFTLRLILVIKGRRGAASLFAMVEVFIYLAGLQLVLQNLSSPIHMAAYCIGFGLGVYLGSRIEEKLALGYSVVQVIADSVHTALPDKLRQYGYGVTTWVGEGRNGHRLVMQVLVKRSNERKLLERIEADAPKAFVISHEPRHFRGGFWAKMLEK
ncbi:uncharacterized protein YebE (UPF0316 family) [Paenibacillus phyllosphaerae]|uniref:UPF0316 protein FHS18_005540 n=1 Tax=Paenibacillus phyllosphaerae TaxID=274593 RepID=A0A7W5FQL8_9BACL|nr:DUF2179 domain-containing protein [Paenibacillus phyllosphaerae]MBB3113428.1 uncharacterized protein YebE (UPF0316 family) [Paenibacillus phyllosphaerae]